jgi:hypothetical protein
MLSTANKLIPSKKIVEVVFDKDWMGFREGQEKPVFEYVADGLIKQKVAHLKQEKTKKEPRILVEKKIEMKDKPVEQPKEKEIQKEFKRPEKDKMIKKATISK